MEKDCDLKNLYYTIYCVFRKGDVIMPYNVLELKALYEAKREPYEKKESKQNKVASSSFLQIKTQSL